MGCMLFSTDLEADFLASSISDLPAPAAQTSAGRTTCSLLPWTTVLPPGHPSTHPHIQLFLGDVSLNPQPTSQRSYSPQRGHPLSRLPRLRVVPFLGLIFVHHPLCSRHGMVNVVNERHPSEVDYIWRG